MTCSQKPISNLSPLDGRYHGKTQSLKPIFSEYGLIYHRLVVEVRWFQALAAEALIVELPPLSLQANRALDELLENFDEAQAELVKQYEQQTNHDVKAVEYYLRDKTKGIAELAATQEFWHFACTSEDINNTAYALMLKQAQRSLLELLGQLLSELEQLARQHAGLAMLSRTHGQTASPTTLGKEMANFCFRLKRQIKQLNQQPFLAKMNGAVGNFNAHVIAYPEVDWPRFSSSFVESLGLLQNPLTTQIEAHDFCAELAHNWIRISAILLDFSRDIWLYISQHYFKQTSNQAEIGSSTMPHKVNPIDFENAEGNLGLAQVLLGHLGEKLMVSRLQRDLSDSTVQRNWGSAFGYLMIALDSLLKGVAKLEVNHQSIARDLNNSPEVLTEAVQTVMRRYGIQGGYEKLKNLSRGRQMSYQHYLDLVESLAIPQKAKQRLIKLKPEGYIGLAKELVERY